MYTCIFYTKHTYFTQSPTHTHIYILKIKTKSIPPPIYTQKCITCEGKTFR